MTSVAVPASGWNVRRFPPLSRPLWILAFFLLGIWAIASVFAESPASGIAPVTDLTWHDDARNRDVPVRIYSPASGTPPFPVIVFSHGLGGSREGYSYLGKYWAAHGYVSVHVQHLGSDSAVIHSAAALQESISNVDNFVNRPKDISFALDRLTALNQTDGPWRNRLDLARIGVAGHSFGAYTTMAIAGATFAVPRLSGLSDPRVKAVVAMSVPNVPGTRFDSITLPALHFTGTFDEIAIQHSPVKDRRIPYDQSRGPGTYLVIFQGGDHMVFSGRLANPREHDVLFQDLVCQGSTAFWDAYLKDDAAAKGWLNRGGFETALGSSATLEKK
ncbi:Predicted dienelactone hydrolase [Verrucomicrobium sp. GAS474]|uniref:alpha/beta hydrolase family protein n=1 Tax=Verrucomicrobium sp. GAS474 TaxID=1882831 RepID=UPI00087981EA|nr:acetylhydrolase [Verrucomicrobium sp. GAS474]SDU20648.1 Predicted dienelactone hydrolase [Verrucomicrobium sp. GAS474]